MKSPVVLPLLHRKKSGRSDGYAGGWVRLLVRSRALVLEAKRPIFKRLIAHF
jgi:hypothetical protein